MKSTQMPWGAGAGGGGGGLEQYSEYSQNIAPKAGKKQISFIQETLMVMSFVCHSHQIWSLLSMRFQTYF